MTERPQLPPPEDEQQPKEDPPASVVFMELMRRHAEQALPPGIFEDFDEGDEDDEPAALPPANPNTTDTETQWRPGEQREPRPHDDPYGYVEPGRGAGEQDDPQVRWQRPEQEVTREYPPAYSTPVINPGRADEWRQPAPAQPAEPGRGEAMPHPHAEAPTMTPEQANQREVLRQRRQERRKLRRRQRAMGFFGGMVRTFFTVGVAAIITATIFTWWTDPDFIAPTVRDDLSVALATATSQSVAMGPTALPATPNFMRRIGVISGHRGPEGDPGAVCPDGLTEAEINLNVAQRLVRNLQSRGYTVDLLDEFDPRLNNYQAELLLSIHANTCTDYGEVVSGYLISTADARVGSGNDQLLVECVAQHYEQASRLPRRYGLTRDMTDYHVFRKIDAFTPGAIVELGFMFNDRDLLVNQPDLLARGIAEGVLCFLEPSDPNILATLAATPPTQ